MAPGMAMFISRSLWSRLKYLSNCWMDGWAWYLVQTFMIHGDTSRSMFTLIQWSISINTWWISIEFCAVIHGSQMLNLHYFHIPPGLLSSTTLRLTFVIFSELFRQFDNLLFTIHRLLRESHCRLIRPGPVPSFLDFFFLIYIDWLQFCRLWCLLDSKVDSKVDTNTPSCYNDDSFFKTDLTN